MRRHEVIVAVLHGVAALFVAGSVAVVWICAAMLAPLMAGSFIPHLIADVGRPIAIFLLAVAALDLIGACRVLARPASRAGRILLVVSLLLLPVFPIGTGLGIYTLWAVRWTPRPSSPPSARAVRSFSNDPL